MNINININKNSGFTLVEISIVLVIIGLLIGGVLKGQEMINNAKINRIASDFESVAAAIFSYQDRYRTLPGDDNRANARWGTGVVNGNSNGTVTGGWSSTTNTDESRIFWQHLRNSNMVPGAGTGADSYAQPKNSYGGIIGVQVNAYGMSGIVVCMSNITGPNAEIIDNKLDDGIPSTGSVRVSTTLTAYAAASTYNMCRKL
ncbi:hypothetical protein MNBD_GAMMA12-453 [hydrothermal vent metagenome]|uniref:Uncharacterized protein n=1 Tax=hydrothermal vent metagenome TaxID=652676 RepID=A0A3B0ZD22_9ZZZZ